MESAIAALPEIERTVMQAHLDGLSLPKIAKQIGHSVSWVRTKLAEAREIVAAQVNGKGTR
jgi:DNA-directed RNA polymerase specialized sigma24 family protein